MASPSLLVFFVFFTFDFALGNSCGGLLEGEYGRFSLSDASNQYQPKAPNSSCLWIIQLHYKTSIRFTLDVLGQGSDLNVYAEDQLTSCNVNGHTKLNSTHVGSAFKFPGKTLIVILPDASASVAFTWEFIGDDNNNNSSRKMKNSDFVSSPNGLLEWGQLEIEERVTWAITSDASVDIRWNVNVATSCNEIDNCACFYFAIFQLNSRGILSEAVRTCGQSSEGQLKGISGRFVVLIKVNTEVEANKIAVSRELDDLNVTEPPVSTATSICAATETGLVAINLQTMEATALTSECALTVAVNHKQRKVYWAEVAGDSRIMRSNLDGSAKEIILPQTGDNIHVMAIDEPTGNVYFALRGSHEITVCNALGQNCDAAIYSSSLVNLTVGIALDYDNGVMYWGNGGLSPDSVVRANLDGSEATTISTGFTSLFGIALEQSSNDVLYWTDYGANTIGTMYVNGSNKLALVHVEGNPGPFGIQVDAHKIYFSNLNSRSIQSVDKVSGKDTTTLLNSTGGVRQLALYHANKNING